MKKLLFIAIPLLLIAVGIFFACKSITLNRKPKIKAASDLPLDKIKLPEGFEISVFADKINARSLCLGTKGTLFVGTRTGDSVYALRDEDGDFVAESRFLIDDKLNSPNGVAFKDGDLYVAEISRILKYENIEERLSSPPEPQVVYDKLPTEGHHGWKYIAFGPDGKLYVPVGAPCNVCDKEEPVYASITRLNPDGSEFEVYAEGVRNTVGFNWHPETGELWFTENGRDWMGDDMPACELNHAPKKGLHFGFPYCHQGDTPDPKFGKDKSCADYVAPVQKLGPHVAPLGMEFYQGTQFPKSYQNQILLAEHGSWNREERIGYRVMLVRLEGNKALSYEPFADGWLQEGEPWGRPVDLEHLPDGSLLVSDDFADAIYRIAYVE